LSGWGGTDNLFGIEGAWGGGHSTTTRRGWARVRLRPTSKKEEVELRNGSQSDMWRLSDRVTVTPRVSGVHKKNVMQPTLPKV
jgi:hypothetical protein